MEDVQISHCFQLVQLHSIDWVSFRQAYATNRYYYYHCCCSALLLLLLLALWHVVDRQ